MQHSEFIKVASKWARKLEERLVDGRISGETARRQLESQTTTNQKKIFSDNFYTEGTKGSYTSLRRRQLEYAQALRKGHNPLRASFRVPGDLRTDYMDGLMSAKEDNTPVSKIREMRQPRYLAVHGYYQPTLRGADPTQMEHAKTLFGFNEKADAIGAGYIRPGRAERIYGDGYFPRQVFKDSIITRMAPTVRDKVVNSVKGVFDRYGVRFNDSVLLEAPARSTMRFSPHVFDADATRTQGRVLDGITEASRVAGNYYKYSDVDRNPLYETVLDSKSGLKSFLRSRVHEVIPPGSPVSGTPVLNMPTALSGRIYKGATSARHMLSGLASAAPDTWWSGLPEVSARYAEHRIQNNLAETTTRPFLAADANKKFNREVVRTAIEQIRATNPRRLAREVLKASDDSGVFSHNRALSKLHRHGVRVNLSGPNPKVFSLLGSLPASTRQTLLHTDRPMARTAASFARGSLLASMAQESSTRDMGDVARLSQIRPKYDTNRQKFIGDASKHLSKVPVTLLNFIRRKFKL